MLPRITRSCDKALAGLGVQAVYLFGSRAVGAESPLADYDYGILTEGKGNTKGDSLYFKLYEILSGMSPRSLRTDVIDIVYMREAPLEFKFHIVRYGRVLYDGDPKARARFEAETTLLYCDYRPLLDQADRTMMEGL